MAFYSEETDQVGVSKNNHDRNKKTPKINDTNSPTSLCCFSGPSHITSLIP